MKVCKICKKELSYENFTKSKNVKDGYENVCKKCRQNQRKKYTNKCETCGKEFKTANKNSKYCSSKCKPQSTKNKVKVNCFICNAEKYITPSHAKMYKHFYCSDECKNKGYSLLYSGRNSARYSKVELKCDVCGKKFTKNKYEAEKHKKHYCSVECKIIGYRKQFSGENNPNYNPNKPQEEREQHRNIEGYTEWRRQVFERDNYTCQCCGDNKGGNLRAHHIINYTEDKNQRTSLNNGITLCENCHKKFHDENGYKHNNLIQITNFLNKYANTEPSQ